MQAKTIAALVLAQAAVLLTTDRAPAGGIKLAVQEQLSYLTYTEVLDLSQIGAGVHVTTPQYPDPDGAGPITGSDTAHFFGLLHVRLTPGFIELLPGEQVTLRNNNTPGEGGIPGAFHPFDPVYSDPSGLPGGVTPQANLGVMTGDPLSYSRVLYGLHGDWFTTDPGPRPLLAGGHFNYSPGADLLLAAGGRRAATSILGGNTESMVGQPFVAFGTGGIATPSWDPQEFTTGFAGTLRLPIESAYFEQFDLGPMFPGAIGIRTIMASGMIVATPIPEPPSMALGLLGFLSLLTCHWRLRQAKS